MYFNIYQLPIELLHELDQFRMQSDQIDQNYLNAYLRVSESHTQGCLNH